MAFGIQIPSAIGNDDITDLSSFRVLAVETKTESVTNASQTFTYTAPSGWTNSTGVFFVLPQNSGNLPVFSASSSTTLEASFDTYDSSYKASSWNIFWLVKTGVDVPSGYGLYVKNGNNETVISSDSEMLLSFEQGVLDNPSVLNTGANSFGTPANYDPSDSILFTKLSDGNDIYHIADTSGLVSFTQTVLEYFIVKKSFVFPPPSGFGLAIFTGTGQLCYSSNYSIFPSNGQNFFFDPNIPNTTTVDGTKDLWVGLSGLNTAPFCPDGGAGAYPTFNFGSGISLSGNTVTAEYDSIFNSAPSPAQANAVSPGNALLVQR